MTTEIKYLTKEAAIAAVTQNGYELRYCTPELQDNEDVVMTAIKKNSWALRFASERLTANKAFIMNALNEGVYPWGLIKHATISIQSDLDVMALALEKSEDSWEFSYAQGEVALNKELAAKALVKWGNCRGTDNLGLWDNLHPPLQEFFQRDSCYEKAQSYLYQLEQEKQAELVSGGSTTEDAVVW